jgi:hypothetical protein
MVAGHTRMHTVLLSSPSPEVVDSWPATVPVTERELDIIETYLGQLIGDIMKS